MIAGEMRSKVDRLWTTFWNNGISNPLSVIEQISYLLFIKRLDDLELVKERKAQQLGGSVKNPIFPVDKQMCRWSYFKNLSNAEEMLKIVRDEAFPFIKNLGLGAAESIYVRHMKDAVFSILEAVGFLAAITSKLAENDISVNAVSAYYHDYLFLPANKAEQTMYILTSMSK